MKDILSTRYLKKTSKNITNYCEDDCTDGYDPCDRCNDCCHGGGGDGCDYN